MSWGWVILGLAVQWFVMLAFPTRIGKGVLTKLMWSWPLIGSRLPVRVRMKQVFILIGIHWTIQFGITDTKVYGIAAFWCALIALYVDDYLFGDDEGRRRWESVRNKVKWRMALPEPQPQKDGAA